MSIDTPHIMKKELYFHYGEQCISFSREAQKSKQQKITIKVQPNGRVLVFAPTHQSDEDVITLVKKRGRWIYKKLATFDQQNKNISTHQYISGEAHYYLGKRYLLKVITDDREGHPSSVKLFGGQIQVRLSTTALHQSNHQANLARDIIKKLLDSWYREHAKVHFTKRLQSLIQDIPWVTAPPDIKLINMKTQWGSCSPSGILVLNPNLVKAPRQCVDYVLVHELCHLKEHNHSEAFYQLVSTIMPNWKDLKHKLDEYAGVCLGSVTLLND